MLLTIERVMGAAKQRSTELSEMYQVASESTSLQPPREVYLRPSSLPVCSLTLLDGLIHYELGHWGDWGFGSDYFTAVGTTVHSVIERWCDKSKYRMWGNWICRNRDCKHATFNEAGEQTGPHWQYTDDYTCKSCGERARYEEITIEYLGFKGHIDCILITPTGVIIGDYKTSSAYGVSKPTFRDHNMAYPLQICSYTYMMQKVWGKHFLEKYKLKIKGAALLFICRDNPFKTREFFWEAKFALQFGREILINGYISWNSVRRSMAQRDPAPAIRRRNCSDLRDYQTRVDKFLTYEPCHLLGVCVGSPCKSDKTLKRHFKRQFEALDNA